MKKKLSFILLFILFLIPSKALALNEVNIYFFHSDTCNICEQEKVFLQALKQDRYSNIRVYDYEISDASNYNLMEEAKKMYNITQTGVPFTVIGDKAYAGFNQGAKGIFQKNIYQASINKYENKLGQKLGITYRTDLEGEAKEYKENSSYTVEETSGISHATKKEDTSAFKKYKSSIVLIAVGVLLLVVFIIISVVDFRRDR